MRRIALAGWEDLAELEPMHALVEGVDLVVIRYERDGQDQVSVLFGRCHHRGALLGADAIAVSNAAIQAIGCLGMRACHTNNCPVGIATQKKGLRARLVIEESAERLKNFFEASSELMTVLARAGTITSPISARATS